MTRSFGKLILLSLGFLSLSGCYMNASISSLNDPGREADKVPVVDKSSASGFISGSAQYVVTPQLQYKVHSSVGSYVSQSKVKTSKGYLVYSSVQGVLVSK